ncbi:hypothetical protein B0H13DRAFT_1850343 [Mycena leptocephala]|nr:hypothetical protein B0H13DRAFT_1850343 [Mycena leptocephala]
MADVPATSIQIGGVSDGVRLVVAAVTAPPSPSRKPRDQTGAYRVPRHHRVQLDRRSKISPNIHSSLTPSKVLTCEEFKHLMVYVVQDVQDESHSNSSPVEMDKLTDFVTLCTAASPAIAPPAAILGLTFLFVKWLSDAVSDNMPDVQGVLIAYTVDLILVMKELFLIALQRKVFGKVTWGELTNAFQAYGKAQSVHEEVRALIKQRGKLGTDFVREHVEDLVYKHTHMRMEVVVMVVVAVAVDVIEGVEGCADMEDVAPEAGPNDHQNALLGLNAGNVALFGKC